MNRTPNTHLEPQPDHAPNTNPTPYEPTPTLNRPGFPGDSIGWEIMDSWED